MPPRGTLALERYEGCLLGQCLGDALGFPLEGHPPEACRAYVDDELCAGGARMRGRGRFPFGQYTDDSQLARELLQSFCAVGRFDPADYAARVAALFAEERVVGRGRATETAAVRLCQGVPWDQAGTPPPAAGNGSAMRAAPIGLLFPHDEAGLVRAAHDQGRITHRDPRCSAGAVVIAGAVALVLRNNVGEPLAADVFTAGLAELARPLDASVADAIAALPGWLHEPEPIAARAIAALGDDPLHGGGWQGISPFVTSSVAWSVYSFLRHPDDYWQAVATAIAAGGDVDTTAAMTGAISGARLGAGALPGRLVAQLQDRGTWREEELRRLAAHAHRLVHGA